MARSQRQRLGGRTPGRLPELVTRHGGRLQIAPPSGTARIHRPHRPAPQITGTAVVHPRSVRPHSPLVRKHGSHR